MAYPEFYIQQGQVIKYTTDNPPNGLFSLNKFFKKMLTRYNVAFVDVCCTEDPTNQSVRFNTTSGHLEYFHTTTNTWVTVPNL